MAKFFAALSELYISPAPQHFQFGSYIFNRDEGAARVWHGCGMRCGMRRAMLLVIWTWASTRPRDRRSICHHIQAVYHRGQGGVLTNGQIRDFQS